MHHCKVPHHHGWWPGRITIMKLLFQLIFHTLHTVASSEITCSVPGTELHIVGRGCRRTWLKSQERESNDLFISPSKREHRRAWSPGSPESSHNCSDKMRDKIYWPPLNLNFCISNMGKKSTLPHVFFCLIIMWEVPAYKNWYLDQYYPMELYAMIKVSDALIIR